MLSIRAGGEASGPKSARSVSLADIRDHRVRLTWNDAVSVVLELADALGDGRTVGVGPATGVHLLADGSVQVTELVASSMPPVMALAGLLQALLEGTKPPAELSALAEDNLGPAVRHKSLEEFRHALGFFDRPGRLEALTALYERASKAMGSRDLFARLKAKTEPSAAREDDASDAEGGSGGRNFVATLVGLAFLVAVVGGGFWWKHYRVASKRAAIERAARRAAEAEAERRRGWPVYAGASSTDPVVGEFRTSGASKAVTHVGGRPEGLPPRWRERPARQTELAARTGSAVGATTPAQASWTDSVLQTSKVLFARAQQAVDAMVDKGFALYARLTAGEPPADDTPVVADRTIREAGSTRSGGGRARRAPHATGPMPGKDPNMQPLVFDRQPEPAEVIVASVAAAPRVYTAADAGIVPPTMLKPQLPNQPRWGVRSDEAGALDLLISERGSVEHVRLVSPANRFHDRMLVSAAKTWLFAPATLDGAPVRFRARIPITW